MKRFFLLTMVLTLGCWLSNPSYATVTIYQDLSPNSAVDQIDPFNITGSDMVGMLVTFTWKDASNTTYSATVPWVLGQGNFAGEANYNLETGGSFSLQEQNKTYGDPWDINIKHTATGMTLIGITLDGLPGMTVFDRSFGDTFPGIGHEDLADKSAYFGTAGSYRGLDFEKTGGKDINVIVTYYGAVALGDAVPVGDVFRFMKVDFGIGLEINDQYSWKADTDKVSGGDFPVPLPPTALLVGSGLLGLAGWRRFRKS